MRSGVNRSVDVLVSVSEARVGQGVIMLACAGGRGGGRVKTIALHCQTSGSKDQELQFTSDLGIHHNYHHHHCVRHRRRTGVVSRGGLIGP